MWACFRSHCCFCCWENSNHLEFPCFETLPGTAALGPKIALLALVWAITEQSAVDRQPIGIVPKGESATFLGMPSAHGDHEKAGKGEGFKESLCCQMLQLQMFGKTFSKGLEQGPNCENWSFYYCDWKGWHSTGFPSSQYFRLYLFVAEKHPKLPAKPRCLNSRGWHRMSQNTVHIYGFRLQI